MWHQEFPHKKTPLIRRCAHRLGVKIARSDFFDSIAIAISILTFLTSLLGHSEYFLDLNCSICGVWLLGSI